MPRTRFENSFIVKNSKGENYRCADGKSVMQLPHVLTMDYAAADNEDLLATFSVGKDEQRLATLTVDKLTLHGIDALLEKEDIKILKELAKEELVVSDVDLDLRLDQQSSQIEYDAPSGTLEIHKTLSNGGKIDFALDPLGLVVDMTDENGASQRLNYRKSIEDLRELSGDDLAKILVTDMVTPKLFEMMMDKNVPQVTSPFEKSKRVAKTPVQLLDMYFANSSQVEGAVNSKTGARYFPPLGQDGRPQFECDFSYVAIPTQDKDDFFYLAKNNSTGTMSVYSGKTGKFNAFSSFNFVRDNHGTPYISFISKNGVIHNYIEIPSAQPDGQTLDGNFLNAIISFVDYKPGENSSSLTQIAGQPSRRHARNKITTADQDFEVSTAVEGNGSATFNLVEDSKLREKLVTGVKDISTSIIAEELAEQKEFADKNSPFEGAVPPAPAQGINPIIETPNPQPQPVPQTEPQPNPQPQPDGRQGQAADTAGGNPAGRPAGNTANPRRQQAREPHPSVARTNPYVEQPGVKKKVVRKSRKINEDWVRYGGTVLGLFMMAMLLIPGAGPILFAAGLAIAAGSILVANNLGKINDNPYNQAYTKYVNTLSKAQNEAEEGAAKFWELDTELGNERDVFAKLQELVLDPRFASTDSTLASNPSGALFEKLFDTTTLEGRQKFEEFWQQSLEYKTAFLEDLRQCYASEVGSAEQVHQKFLQKYGFAADKIDIFTENFDVSRAAGPDETAPAVLDSITSKQALEGAIVVLENYVNCERKISDLHDQEGDIIEKSSARTIERIMAQPNVDRGALVREHADDFARRFLFRKDITDAQRDDFLSKLSIDDAKAIQEAMTSVQRAVVGAEKLGKEQRENDLAFQKCDKSVKIMQDIMLAPDYDSKAAPEGFDELALKTTAQTKQDAQDMFWALASEDAKRNAKARQSIPQLESNGLNALFLHGFDAIGPQNLEQMKNVKGFEEFAGLLDKKYDLATNDNVLSMLAEQVQNAGSGAPIVSSASMREVDQDSLDVALEMVASSGLSKLGKSTAEAKALKSQIADVRTIEEKRKELRRDATAYTTDRIFKQMKWGELEKNPDLKAEIEKNNAKIDNEIQIFTENYPQFASLDEETQQKLAILSLNGVVALQVGIERLHSEKAQKQKDAMFVSAKSDLENIVVALADGTYAEKLVADSEKAYFEKAQSDGKIPTEIKTRRQASDQLLSMDRLLERYNVPPEDRATLIASMSEHAQKDVVGSGKGRDYLTRKDVVRALYDQVKDVELVDCTQSGVETKTALKDLETSSPLISPSKAEKLAKSLSEHRQAAEQRYQQKTKALSRIAGQNQVKLHYDLARKQEEDKSEKPKKETRAQKAYAKTCKDSEKFLSSAANVLSRTEKVGACTTGKAGTKTTSQMQTRVDKLQTSVEKAFGKREIDDMLKLAGKDVDWASIKNKIAAGNFTDADYRALKQAVEKAILKKQKKLAKRLAKRKVKVVNKDKEERKAKKVSKEEIADNKGKFARSVDKVKEKQDAAANRVQRAATIERATPDLSAQLASKKLSHKVEKE